MRRLLLALLLLPLQSWAAQVNVVRCYEPDGVYVPVADVATKCPPKVTGGSTDTVTTTSYNISVSTDKDSGTIYAYTSTSATPPSRKALIAGTGAVHHGTITVSATGAQTRAVTGATADTQYYTHVRHVSTTGRPSNWILIPQRTSAASPPATTTVAGYFWGTGGSDFSAGTSHATRFASLAPVMALSGVATGTDIWGFAGSTHTVTASGLVRSKWGGSGGDPVIWGTYYIDGSTPTAVWEGATGGDLDLTSPNALTENTLGSHTLATIKGALTDACIAAKNCNWNLPISGECSTMDSAIVSISHDYQSFRGMKVSHSSCRGMTVWPGVYGVQDGRLLGFEFWNSIADKNGRQAHILFSGIKYSLIHDSIIRNNQQCSLSRYSGGTYPDEAYADATQNRCANPTSASIFQLSLNSFSGFVNNTLIFNYAENLHCLNVTKFLFRNNRVYNGLKIAYSDACGGAIVERNMLTPFNNNAGYGPGTAGTFTFNGFFEINSEFNQWQPSPAPTDILVRSNIMIGGSRCSAFGLSSAAATGGEQIGGKFYHNTCIAQVLQSIESGHNLNDTVNLGISYLNNVFAAPTTTSSDMCTGNDVTGNYNVYAKTPTDASCKGANDINASAATDTLLTLPVGTSASPNTANIATWRTSDYDNPPDHENARPTAGTYTGTRLNNVQCISDADLVEWQHIFDLMTDPPTPSTWKMCAAEYFDGEAIANTPVLGALGN